MNIFLKLYQYLCLRFVNIGVIGVIGVRGDNRPGNANSEDVGSNYELFPHCQQVRAIPAGILFNGQ